MHQIRAIFLLSALAAAAILCAFPADARGLKKSAGFLVKGRVFCDTCKVGFETPVTSYIAGAKVKVECRSKTGLKTFAGTTDRTGTYTIYVTDEHEHELCDTVLISSPDSRCAMLVKGRERARVFLTHNNGISSDVRFANAMGFEMEKALGGCGDVLKMYEEKDD
ncbi:hypothetical protein LUZ60_005746 [Juncus effusus]|nr:hypothetical protein LUZ60_005746 [Juncus effusus]